MVGSWEWAGMIEEGGVLTLGLAILPTSPSPLYSVLPLYTRSSILPSSSTNGLRSDCAFMLGWSWGMTKEILRDLVELTTFGLVRLSRCQPRSTFYKTHKSLKIIIYILPMTENVALSLFWAIMITESRYATVLFQSCQNFLLYFQFTFYLSTLQNRCSHS